MVLPGWNVSEPIDLAYKLYEVVESLRSAPESARAFVSKINNFRGNLKELQKVLEREITSQPTQDLQHLSATVLECKAVVERCEEYSERFRKLTKDGRGKMDGAGQAARWMLQKEKVARLREDIDGQMNSIQLTLAIKTFADGRARQGSQSATEGLHTPIRSGTITSLPPYASPQPNWTPGESLQHAKTPADFLGLGIKHTRKKSDTDIPTFQLEQERNDGQGTVASPQTSPNTLRPLTEHDERSSLDLNEAMKPLERRRNTNNEVSISSSGLGISSALSEDSSAASRVFTSPTISSQRTSMTEATTNTSRRDSIFTLDSAAVEMVMDNLSGVQASYYKEKSLRSYPVATIESFRDKQTGRRYIVISPPTIYKTKLYLIPPTERIIAHSEHPQAYGSIPKHTVKFIERYSLKSQRIPSERQPLDAPVILSPSLTPASSAASVASSRSLGSPVLIANSGALKEESRCQMYDFENRDDYRRFQEMLMGADVRLQLQIPVQSITANKYVESKPSKESELQYLRLWRSGGRQTLMYFANLLKDKHGAPGKYREYKMENLRPAESKSKSKTTIRLDVHLPGMVRRSSSSKSPVLIDQLSTQELADDENDMSNLDFLLIEFGSAEDRTAFLREARFHLGEPIASPFSRSPTK
ncbi:MAG: hypothetical protein Q9161_008936 [Pseudevernia consocians]